MKTFKQLSSKPYVIQRQPVRLNGGPLNDAIIWLDEPDSPRTTAPFRTGTHHGYYHDRKWRSL